MTTWNAEASLVKAWLDQPSTTDYLLLGNGTYLFLDNGQRLALNIRKPINVVWDAAVSSPKTWS